MQRAARAKRQHGVVIIYLAFFLLTLLGFVALAIDVAHFCVVKTKLQNCADASALAAVVELPDQERVQSVGRRMPP